MQSTTRWIASLAVVAAAGPALAASGFEGGAWRHQVKMVSAQVPGVSEGLVKLFAGGRSRTSCETVEGLQSHAEGLFTADKNAVCKLRKLSLDGGQVVFDTFCTNKRFPEGLLVSSRGSWTPTNYSITTTSTGTKDGKPVKIVTTGTGSRTAPRCTAQ